MQQGVDARELPASSLVGHDKPVSTVKAIALSALQENSEAPVSPAYQTGTEPKSLQNASKPNPPQRPARSRSMSPSKMESGTNLVQRKLGKEEMQAMAERLTRKEAKEKKELKAHPMQLKYEYDAKSRKYTEKYIRAKKVSGEAQTEYLKALNERCITKQQQTEEALRQKYLKPLNPDAKKVNKAGMEEHMAKLQQLAAPKARAS